MANIDPRPDDRRRRIFGSRDTADRESLGEHSTGRSTGPTIAGILLVIGLILLGLMFLTPTRTPPVNNPVPQTGPVIVPPATTVPPTTPAAPGIAR